MTLGRFCVPLVLEWCLETNFGCAPGIWWVETKDAPKHPTGTEPSPMTKHDQVPNANNGQVEKLCIEASSYLSNKLVLIVLCVPDTVLSVGGGRLQELHGSCPPGRYNPVEMQTNRESITKQCDKRHAGKLKAQTRAHGRGFQHRLWGIQEGLRER